MRHSKRMLKEIRRALLAGLALSVGLHVLLLILPLSVVEIFRLGVPQGSLGAIGLLSGLALAAVVAAAVISEARHVVLVRAGLWLDHELGHVLLEHGLRRGLPASEIARHGAELASVRTMMTGGAAASLLDAASIPLIVGAVALASPLLGLTAAVTAALLALMARRRARYWSRLAAAADEAREANRREWALRAEIGQAAAALGLAEGLASHWEVRNRAFVAKAYGAAKRAGVTAAAALAAGAAGLIAFSAVGAWLSIEGRVDAPLLAASILLMAALLVLMGRLISASGELSQGLAALMSLDALAGEAGLSRPKAPLSGSPAAMVLENVTYAYPGNAVPALSGVSLMLRRGECVGVMGAAGSGKTALAQILAGLAVPASGTALIDGLAISDWQKNARSPRVGYVADDPLLLDGSVIENILRFKSESPDLAIEAAQRAGVHDILAALPQGFHTRIGPMGRALSMRERRAIAFARAMASEPAFLVVDTPEHGLDGFEARRLEQVLLEIMSTGIGIVLLTNDGGLIGLAHRRMVLDRGRMSALDIPRPHAFAPSFARASGY